MNCSWSVAAGAGCCGGALRAGGGGGLREKRNGGRCDQENQSERAEQGPGGQAVHGGLHRVSEQSLTPRTNRCQLNIWAPGRRAARGGGLGFREILAGGAAADRMRAPRVASGVAR